MWLFRLNKAFYCLINVTYLRPSILKNYTLLNLHERTGGGSFLDKIPDSDIDCVIIQLITAYSQIIRGCLHPHF